ncbi:hypothetical protein L21SP3_01312 [Sedimentisphaera cyanobacteriorum]|uniref:DUF502 domain-containing protein n=1 Tax=Sedimentisphaera cyanobacteriorum TaxID=1940790 RepID=A0A1Q2HPY2_9BACT|nr:DUF502 domain-containing protein [Sedimentisphaera cyanobacteriorum]AQQ09507.1 hypothetical protein L21SP3_01312 [Sedimentisphaera cyanobacteriorum]
MRVFRDIRNYFLRGVAALLPTILTFWLFVQFYLFIQENLSRHINGFIVKLIIWAGSDQPREELVEFWVNGKGQTAGFLVIFIVVCFLGAFLASVVGKTIWKYFENLAARAPIVRNIYPNIKQVTDSVFSQHSIAFKKVVAVEYPRAGIWSVGMVTGSGIKQVTASLDMDLVSIFIPSSPTPFTGYVIMVPAGSVIDLDMTVEEALRFTISGGVITPSEWEDLQLEQTQDSE